MNDETLYKHVDMLLVEDNPDDLRLFREMLNEVEEMSINFQHAKSLSEALSTLEKLKIEIIFMDLGLPDSSGLEGLLSIQSRFPGIAVVILTGLDDELTGVRAVRLGAQDYLVKDQVNGNLLSRVIRYSIERKKAEMELKRTKNELQTSESRFRLLIEKNADAIVIVDREGVIRFVNPAAEALWGFAADEMVGSAFGFPLVNDRYIEISIRGKRGKAVIAEMHAVDFKWEGSAAHLVSIRDVTQKKKLEDEAQKLEKLASLSRLSGGIAHDFNNALTAIEGNIEMAKTTIQPQSPTGKWLNRAEKACAKAETLSNMLFDFSKKEKPLKMPVSTAKLFNDLLWQRVKKPYIKLECNIARNAWDIEIESDQVKQAFAYLIANAEEAMPGGGKIKIKVENLHVAKKKYPFLTPGKYVKIAIKDEGMGIQDKDIPNIFDPYFTTKEGKIGLGLSIAYSVIKRHGGLITVESRVGKGTTLYIYLPAIEKRGEIAGKGKSKLRPGTAPARDRRILVMEDDPDIREIAGGIFKHLGYEAAFAGNGDEAVKLFLKAEKYGIPFSLVIMNLAAPDKLGARQAVKRLLELEPGVKAIAACGDFQDPALADYTEYGFIEAFAKPYKLKMLEQLLNKLKID